MVDDSGSVKPMQTKIIFLLLQKQFAVTRLAPE